MRDVYGAPIFLCILISLIEYFRLNIGCVSMSPPTTRGQVVTRPAYASDVEAATTKSKIPHRRPQAICTTERLPALFAWALLLITSFSYWICILPAIIQLLPKFLPLLIFHVILFVILCGNFVLATFMDPVSD